MARKIAETEPNTLAAALTAQARQTACEYCRSSRLRPDGKGIPIKKPMGVKKVSQGAVSAGAPFSPLNQRL